LDGVGKVVVGFEQAMVCGACFFLQCRRGTNARGEIEKRLRRFGIQRRLAAVALDFIGVKEGWGHFNHSIIIMPNVLASSAN